MSWALLNLYNHFRGWRMVALFAAFLIYTLWFTGPGFFGQMGRLPNYTSLQESGFYSGAQAVATLSALEGEARITKLLALIFDVPYMVMQTLVFGAFIAFGLGHWGKEQSRWRVLVFLPAAFLLFDALEDSFIAATLFTQSEAIGGIAGVMTAAKFAAFLPSILASLIMLIIGGVAWARAGRKES